MTPLRVLANRRQKARRTRRRSRGVGNSGKSHVANPFAFFLVFGNRTRRHADFFSKSRLRHATQLASKRQPRARHPDLPSNQHIPRKHENLADYCRSAKALRTDSLGGLANNLNIRGGRFRCVDGRFVVRRQRRQEYAIFPTRVHTILRKCRHRKLDPNLLVSLVDMHDQIVESKVIMFRWFAFSQIALKTWYWHRSASTPARRKVPLPLS